LWLSNSLYAQVYKQTLKALQGLIRLEQEKLAVYTKQISPSQLVNYHQMNTKNTSWQSTGCGKI